MTFNHLHHLPICRFCLRQTLLFLALLVLPLQQSLTLFTIIWSLDPGLDLFVLNNFQIFISSMQPSFYSVHIQVCLNLSNLSPSLKLFCHKNGSKQCNKNMMRSLLMILKILSLAFVITLLFAPNGYTKSNRRLMEVWITIR